MTFLETLSLKPIATGSAILFWIFIFSLIHPSIRRFFSSKIFFEKDTRNHILWIDSFRGLAALYVFLSHSWCWAYPIFRDAQLSINMLAHGSKGVGIFFMLSGYLISRQLYLSYPEPTVENIRRYFLRRFFRIYPLYAFSVILLAVCSEIYSSVPNVNKLSFIVSDFFMLRIYWARVFGNPVTWTLYMEILLYVITPLMIWAIPKKNMLTTIVLCFLVLVLVVGDCSGPRELWVVKYFLLGIIVLELHRKFSNFNLSLYGYPVVVLGTIFLLLDLQGPSYDLFEKLHLTYYGVGNPYTLGLGLSFALILIGLGLIQTPSICISAFLNFIPLRALGLISYSLYLLHPIYLMWNFPELQDINVIGKLYENFNLQQRLPNWYFWGVFVVGLIPWAILSFILIEQPFLKINLKFRESKILNKPVLS